MTTKKKDKKGYEKVEEEEWIEMVDLNDPVNESMSRKFATEEGKRFQPSSNKESLEYLQLSYKQEKIEEKEFGREAGKGNYPAQLSGKQNERKPRAEKKMKKPSIPMMSVTCDFCTVSQNVPGNTQVYTCGSCQNMNECQPLYAVFVCGFCQTKVCYGLGISIMIKCPKCKSVNKVPAEAAKKYESKGPLERSPAPQFQKERQWQQFPGEK